MIDATGSVMLFEFGEVHRDEIIRRCRAKVATLMPLPTKAEIDHGVPLFLDQLVNALRLKTNTRELEECSGRHPFFTDAGRRLCCLEHVASQLSAYAGR
jgi:hypothetical protein